MIEEKIPLKQGLKHESIKEGKGNRKIEEKIPLKQGLKQLQEAVETSREALLKRRFH